MRCGECRPESHVPQPTPIPRVFVVTSFCKAAIRRTDSIIVTAHCINTISSQSCQQPFRDLTISFLIRSRETVDESVGACYIDVWC
jgi:hypothetical protein